MPSRPDTITVTVANAGTQLQAGAAAGGPLVEKAYLRADPANNGIMYVGAADVSATNGYPMDSADAPLVLENADGSPIDLSLYWIDASVNGEKAMFFFHRED